MRRPVTLVIDLSSRFSGDTMRFLRCRLLALGLGVALAGLSSAAEPVDGAVKQLAHPRYAVREKAAKQLVEIGEPALPSLRALLASPDQEERQRAERLIARIESAARSQKLLVAPKLRIKFDDKPLDKAVAEVAKLTKLPLVLNVSGPADKVKVTVDTGELPYWGAVEAFLKAAGLGDDLNTPPGIAAQPGIDVPQGVIINGPPGGYIYNPVAAPRAMRLTVAAKPAPSFTANAIRVKAAPATFAFPPVPTAPGTKPDGGVRVHLQVDAHPSLTIHQITGIDVRTAKAVGGRSLEIVRTVLPVIGNAQDEMMLNGNLGGLQVPVQQLQVDSIEYTPQPSRSPLVPVVIKPGAEKVKELEELSGVLTARLVAPKDTLFTIDRVKESGGRSFSPCEGLRVNFKSAATRLTRTAVVRLTIEIDPAAQNIMNFQVPFTGRGGQFLRINGGDYGNANGPAPEFYLTMPSGETRKALSVGATAIESTETGTRYDLEIQFEKPEKWEGVGLVAKGRRVVTVEMPFTLKNVQLP